jgi:splicing factor 3A subunit 3
MSSSIIETTRVLHSDIEKSVRVVVNEIKYKSKSSQKRKVYQDHRINDELEEIQNKSRKLIHLYEDKDQSREKELELMAGATLQKTLNTFDAKLSEIKEYHRKFTVDSNMELEKLEDKNKMELALKPVQEYQLEKIIFSGEEEFGKYIDLHEFHQEFSNMKQFLNENPVDYLNYLQTFFHFHLIEPNLKDENYLKYISRLLDYLQDFYSRTQPLSDIENILKIAQEEFEKKWNEQENEENKVVKEQVMTEGGNEEKKKKRKRKRGNNSERKKKISLIEEKIQRYYDELSEVVDATILNLEKKQTRTWEENQNEILVEEKLEETEIESLLREKKETEPNPEEDDDETLGKNANPLNIPLGWDGKPIPYWLFKLHGLGIEFKCEICGDYTYFGPKAFEKHFQEFRHAHGMRCLKIPNTRHFHQITKIQDALNLWKKIKDEVKKNHWDKDQEEFEDKHGNVFNKKTYDDLQRQGYISE